MALSVVDIYRDILPKTNCGDCGQPTCLAFASMVVSEQYPLSLCPHIPKEVIARCAPELKAQYAARKWTKRDMAEDALQWARSRAASMDLHELPARIGGRLVEKEGKKLFALPCLNFEIEVFEDDIRRKDGAELDRWEKVFLYNHLAQGGSAHPTGKWKGFSELPHTVSKMVSMKNNVEAPLIRRFSGKKAELARAAKALGGQEVAETAGSAELAVYFRVLPRVPVMLLFWDAAKADGFEAEVKLLFDETVTEHLDIESILFLSERLAGLLTGEP